MSRNLVPCANPRACGVVHGHEPGTICRSARPSASALSGVAPVTSATRTNAARKPIFRRFQSNAYSSQLGALALDRTRNGWRSDAPYQRGLVWGVDRKRKLIESALMGIPISSIIVNSRPITAQTRDDEPLDYVVDGKQRLSALYGYIDDEFAVPAEWFAEEEIDDSEEVDGVEMVRYSGLSNRAQRKVESISVPILQTNLADEDAERELFDRLNFGGVPQGQSDFE